MGVKRQFKINGLIKCILIAMLSMDVACIEAPPPNTNPAPDDMPQDTRPDTMDEQPDEPDAEPDIDPDADMEPVLPCDGACVEALCVNDACIECTAETGCEANPNGEVCKIDLANPAQNSCVQCVDSGDCSGATSVCDTSTNTCVGCVSDMDCPANAPVCGAGNTCGACTVGNNGACADRGEEAKVCAASGGCVECNPDTAMVDCDGNSCVNNQCTDTPLAMTGSCGACATDAECLPTHKCIELNFGEGASQKQIGNFCMQVASGVCPRPYGAAIVGRASIDDATMRNYCGINEALTTCAAVLQRLSANSGDPQCANNDECGLPGEDDGICGDVLLLGDRCTYRCADNNECGVNQTPSGARTCTLGVCN